MKAQHRERAWGWLSIGAIALSLIACDGGRAVRPRGLRQPLDTLSWKKEIDSLLFYSVRRDLPHQQVLAERIYTHTRGVDSLARQQALALETMADVRSLKDPKDDSALTLVNEGLRIAEAANDSVALSKLFLRLGDIDVDRGDMVGGMTATLRALAISDALGDRIRSSRLMSRLGILYWEQHDMDAAIAITRRSIAMSEGLDSSGWCEGLEILALLMLNSGRADTAVVLNRQCIPLELRFRPGGSGAVLYGNLGWAYADVGLIDSALWSFRKGLEVARRIGDNKGAVNSWTGIGEMLSQLERYAEAGAPLDSGLALAQRSHLTSAEQDLHALLTDQRENVGDLKGALMHLRRRTALTDSIMTTQKEASMNELRVRYETEKKERENQQLRAAQEVAELRAQRGRWIAVGVALLALMTSALAWMLLQRNRERARRREDDLEQQAMRLQMDPHFLFNALNTIPGLYASGDAGHANDHVGHLSKFLRSVLETSRKRTIALSQELELVENYLHICANRRPGSFTWSIEVAPGVHPERVAIPPMLVQPLVENALEHGLIGMEQGGRVQVSVRSDERDVTITVRDNGVGRKAAAQRAAHRLGGSLGLGLVRDRIRVMDPGQRRREVLTVQDEHHADGRAAGTTVTLQVRRTDLQHHVV